MLDVCHCKGVIFMGSESLKKIVAFAHHLPLNLTAPSRKFGTPAATATTAAPKISTAKAWEKSQTLIRRERLRKRGLLQPSTTGLKTTLG